MPDRPGPGGKFPGPGNPVKAPPVPGQPTKAGAPNITPSPGSPCLISYPSAGIPLVGTVGGGCLFSKTNARAWIGGLMIGAGALTVLIGAGVLAASAFKKSGAAEKIAGVVGAVPGGELYAGALRGSGQQVTRAAVQRRQAGASQERRQMRAMGEPRENSNLRTGRGAVRETPAGTRRRKAERPATREETGY